MQVVFGLGKNLLFKFKSVLGHCVPLVSKYIVKNPIPLLQLLREEKEVLREKKDTKAEETR